jgi:hypothetical protein
VKYTPYILRAYIPINTKQKIAIGNAYSMIFQNLGANTAIAINNTFIVIANVSGNVISVISALLPNNF